MKTPLKVCATLLIICILVCGTSIPSDAAAPAKPTVIDGSRCGSGVVVLEANGSTGNYRWYDSETGTQVQGTGSVVSVDVSTTTYFWVAAFDDSGESERVRVTATISSGCPNVSYRGNLMTHVILFHENFNGYTGGLSTDRIGNTPHWDTQPTLNGIVTNSDQGSGTYYIRTNTNLGVDRVLELGSAISTKGYAQIKIIWRHRVSGHNNNRPKLFYSINDGLSWAEVSESISSPSTSWQWVNGDTYVNLPFDAEDKHAIRFRWVIPRALVDQNRYYALDDITVIGTPLEGLAKISWDTRPNNGTQRPNGEDPFTRSVSNPAEYYVDGVQMKWKLNTNAPNSSISSYAVRNNQFQAPKKALTLVQTGANAKTVSTSVTLELSRPVEDLTFTLFDVDTAPSQFRDILSIEGYEGQQQVPLLKHKVLHTSKNQLSGDDVLGVAGTPSTPDNSTDANVTITFGAAVDKVVITYGNLDNARGNQGIGIHDLMWRRSPPVPLPVTLVFFKAVLKSYAAHLTWATAMEKDNDVFIVQRSPDGKTFSAIGEVKGVGNSSILQNYSFSDAELEAGTYYYRLKQVDFDGKFEFSNTVSVRIRERLYKEVAPYPNPVTEVLQVDLRNMKKGDYTVRIIDMGGRVVQQFNCNNKVVLQLPVHQLAPGSYMLHVQGAAQQKTLKFMKQ